MRDVMSYHRIAMQLPQATNSGALQDHVDHVSGLIGKVGAHQAL